MRRFAKVSCALAWLVCLLSDTAIAQMVEVGPGYVRAPFVRVYTGPDGSSRVQAPFVDVFTPGYRLSPRAARPGRFLRRNGVPGDAINGPAQPARDVKAMGWKELRESVRRGSAQLAVQLERFGNKAAGWRTYLHTDDLSRLEAYDDLPPSQAEAQVLSQNLEAFEKTRATESFRAIAALDSFHTVYGALTELLSPPLERQTRLLTDSARRLEQDLMRMATGMQWRTYLALPAELMSTSRASDSQAVLLPPGSGVDPVAGAGAEAEGVENTLDRFDTVSGNPAYRQITELASFQATHRHLATYVALVRDGNTPNADQDVSLEELPPPVPQ